MALDSSPMMRLAPTLLALGVLVFGCAAAPVRRPPVDVSAMREAIEASREREPLTSSGAYAHFLASRLAHEQGDYRRAVEELRLALTSDDGNPFLMTRLAGEYTRLPDLARAELELKLVLERHPDYHPARLMLGRVLLEGKHYALAKYHLRQAVRLDPQDPEGYLGLAQLALEQGSPDEAVREVEALAQALPGEPSGYKRLGLAFAERNDLVRARTMLEKAAERDPGDFESWVMLAQIYEATSRPGLAEAAFDRALELDPDNREVLLRAGKASLAQGSPVRARAYFDRLLSLSDDPEGAMKVAYAWQSARHLEEAAEVLRAARTEAAAHPKVAFLSGLVYEQMRRFAQAADAYAEVGPESDIFHEARLRRAMCLSQAGEHPRALALFEQAVKEQPDYLALYPPYALALERAGRPGEAETLLVQAVQSWSAPELVEALSGLYERQHRPAEAVETLRRAIARRPKDEALRYALGVLYERRGDLEEAVRQMRAVLEVNPKNAEAMNFIGYTLADLGRDLDEAERLLTRALELQPDTGAFVDSMGWLSYRRGNFSRAVGLLERAVELLPGDPTVIEHLGDAYRGAGRRDKAAESWRRALEALRDPEVDGPELQAQRRGIEQKLKMLSTEPRDR